MVFDYNNLQAILDSSSPSCNDEIRENIPEDLGIIQDDGYRSCVHWELRGKGFQLDNPDLKYQELSDEELLRSAFNELKGRKI